MDNWPFWMLEENVKLVNEIMEEEESNRKRDEESQQKGMPDTNAMMKNASSMGNIGNNFSMPSM
jgi:hypothetical protein